MSKTAPAAAKGPIRSKGSLFSVDQGQDCPLPMTTLETSPVP
jgi:hypothetical protein